jgi:hypothetical protein
VPGTGRPSGPFQTDLAAFAAELGAPKPPSADFQTVALPNLPSLADLPHARTAPARPPTSEPELRVDGSRFGVPQGPPSG